MAKVIERDGMLTLRLSWLEKIGALHGDVSVANNQLISKTEVPNPWTKEHLRGVRAPGTAIPYVILLGTMRFTGGKDFCAIYKRTPAVIYEFEGSQFKRWVVSLQYLREYSQFMATTAKKATTQKTAAKKSATKVEVKEVNQGVDWRSLYLYAVSLITLLVCLFTVISLINRGLDLIVPDAGYVDPYAAQNDPKVDPEVIKQANIDQNRRNAIRGITSSLVTLLVTVPVYLYHWKMVRKISR